MQPHLVGLLPGNIRPKYKYKIQKYTNMQPRPNNQLLQRCHLLQTEHYAASSFTLFLKSPFEKPLNWITFDLFSTFYFAVCIYVGSVYLPNTTVFQLTLLDFSCLDNHRPPPPIHPPLTVFVKKWSKIWKKHWLKIVIWATAVILDLPSSIISRDGHFTILQICNKTNLEQNPDMNMGRRWKK